MTAKQKNYYRVKALVYLFLAFIPWGYFQWWLATPLTIIGFLGVFATAAQFAKQMEAVNGCEE